MFNRPQTSASSRPYTASGTLPPLSADPALVTESPSYHFHGHSDYHQQQQQQPYRADQLYAQEEQDEDDEESEAEDVFAYLPPSTADQQAQPSHHQAPPLEGKARLPPPVDHKLVSSPPGTEASYDRALNTGESYRMHPLPSTGGISSREVHVSLPSTGDGFPPHKRLSSAASESMMDIDPSDMHPDGSLKMDFNIDDIEEDEDSPYAEVRASVSNIDDISMPALTFRMWFIGLPLCAVAAGLNIFFNFRQPAPSVIPLVLLLVAYPTGKMCAYAFPIQTYRLPTWLGGAQFCLNPGPFNIKEHVCIYMMSNVSITAPYAMNAIVVAEVFYGRKLGFWFNLTLVLATQLTGFGLAGMCRRFLVWPASMIWPQNLVVCTLLNTLHAEDDEGSGGMSRYRFFMIACAGAFFFFFLPGFLFTALSIFSFVCWIRPQNIPVNQLFGVATGLGMSFLTFDWTQITWIGSPLMVPWWAEVHVFAGFVIFYWILCPILYYTNTWDLAYFPIFSTVPYDRYGVRYDISRIVGSDFTFNQTAYEAYSPLYLPVTYVVTYFLAFALSTCVIVHTILYHGRSLLNGVKRIKVEKDDVHARLMRNYPEVPDWWYAIFFAIFFSLAIVAVEVWNTKIPIWGLMLAVALPIIYILPSGFIFAMTSQAITLNLLAQIIPGTLLPGNPLANMVFKGYAVQTMNEALNFVQDLKLGHYVKVPPRATFIAQAVATILVALVQVGVKEWMFAHVKGICDSEQVNTDHLTCPHNQVYFTASAIWGLIGPQRQFGSGSLYHPQLYALIFGALMPIPFWLWQRRFPKTRLKYISMPVLINGVQFIPPATGINYSSWFMVGFVFQYLVRRRYFSWWSKFNYVLSAALDSGTVISVIVIFFVLQYPKGGNIQLNWWGNTVYLDTADVNQTPLLQTPPQGL